MALDKEGSGTGVGLLELMAVPNGKWDRGVVGKPPGGTNRNASNNAIKLPGALRSSSSKFPRPIRIRGRPLDGRSERLAIISSQVRFSRATTCRILGERSRPSQLFNFAQYKLPMRQKRCQASFRKNRSPASISLGSSLWESSMD